MEKIESYIIKNSKGMWVEILNLGAIVKEINFKGVNRVLNFQNNEDYIGDQHHIGALVGPVAGRISEGSFEINGKSYKVEQNEGKNSLHGGSASLTRRIWSLVEKSDKRLVLSYKAKDGEGGYPGNRVFTVIYSLNEDNEFLIEYEVETDKDTLVTLTNHSYFNFNDDKSDDILDHKLKIQADYYVRLDKNNIPIEKVSVDSSPFDFNLAKKIGKDMDLDHKDLKFTNGYDHPFILRKEDSKIVLSGNDVNLEITTTEPVVILYTGNGLENRTGVCLETQWYPDGINNKSFPDNILYENKKYYSKTKYAFK